MAYSMRQATPVLGMISAQTLRVCRRGNRYPLFRIMPVPRTGEYACSRQRSGRNISISSASGGELQRARSGLPVHAILGGDAVGLVLVGFAANLLGGLLGLGLRLGRGRRLGLGCRPSGGGGG